MDCVRIKLVKSKDLKAKPIEIMADAAQFIQALISDSDREMFVSVNVDNRNEPLNYSIISMGCLDSALVHPREVYKAAILSNAQAVFFFHNHPSGNVRPSTQDFLITDKLMTAGDILGIPVQDHIIVAEDNYFSFAEEGLIGQQNHEEHTSKLNTFDVKKLKELISLSKKSDIPIAIKYDERMIGLYLNGENNPASQWLTLEMATKKLKELLIQQRQQVIR